MEARRQMKPSTVGFAVPFLALASCLHVYPSTLDSSQNALALLGPALLDPVISCTPPYFTPADVGNLELWLEADSLALTDGASVASWTDLSGNGFNATQGVGGLQPTHRTNLFNGKPAIRFTNGNPGTHFTLGANYIFSNNDGLTILSVGRSNVEDNLAQNILDLGALAEGGYGLAVSANADGVGNNARMYAATDVSLGGVVAQGQSAVTSSDQWIASGIVKFSPATDKHVSVHMNGKMTATDTSLTLTQLTANEICEFPTRGGGNNGATPAYCTANASRNGPVTIGGQSKTDVQANRFFDGDIAMILVYRRALTDKERMGLEGYASKKYGITVAKGCN